MNRRKFIAATSVGVGMAGCLTGNGTDDGDDGTDGDGANDANIDVNDNEEGSRSSDPGTDGNGSQNDSNESSADSEPDESDDSTGDDADETDGDENEADDPSGRTTSFESCERATVSGSFADGDVAFASTGFYDDDGLFGNTVIEDGVVFGDDVDAPFSGTVAFEIGGGAGVSEGSDEIVVTVPDYGGVGTVITSLTTEQADYAAGAPTTSNPHAEDCLSELEAEAGGGGDNDSDENDTDGDDSGSADDDSGSDGDDSGSADDDNGSDGNDSGSADDAAASFAVSIRSTNSPVDAGGYLEGTVEVRNTGGAAGSATVDLVVGHDPTTVESRSVSLEAGERTTFTMSYQTPPVASDQQFPVRVETADDSDQQTVRVRGAQ
ncbi:CARDB domain-containing protein [Haloterrigena gelatinilytica]|nr:CARDB domain-containing protein [Haloterrigena gelatinilytica]